MADVQKAQQPISEGAGKVHETTKKTPSKVPTTPTKNKKTQTPKVEKPKVEQPKFEKPKQVEETKQKAEQTKDDVQETAEDTVEDTAGDVDVPEEEEEEEEEDGADDSSEEGSLQIPADKLPQAPSEVPESEDLEGEVEDGGYATSDTKHENVEGQVHDAEGNLEDVAEDAEGEVEGQQEGVEGQAEDVEGEVEDVEGEVEEQKEGAEDQVEGAEGELEEGKEGVEGEVEGAEGEVDEQKEGVDGELEEGVDGQVEGVEGEVTDAQEGVEEGAEELEEEASKPLPDISILKGLKVNKAGNIVDEDGNPLGRLIEGDAKKLAGKTVDEEGKIWNDSGKVIGQAETLPEAEENESAPFEDFPDNVVDKSGKVLFEGQQVGIVIEGEISKLVGKTADADGDILDKNGNIIGKAERKDEEEPAEPEPEPEVEIDYSAVAGCKVNKAGNVVNDKGIAVGRILEGNLKQLIGRQVDDKGQIWNDNGKVIGKVQVIPEEERITPSEGPFEDFPGALVERNGDVIYEGEKIGVVVEGEPKKLAGKKVDGDGDIVDNAGNVVGKAERWEEEETVEEIVDLSSLAGKRVNKAGNLVDSHGDIYGRVKEGVLKNLIGKMADKTGAIRNEGGDVVGRAELVPESEREGLKEGPFADIEGLTVTKEGTVVDSKNVVVGRLIQGDGKQLYGKKVDDDGDVLDKNGNVIGKAERWEEEEVKKDINPMSGRKVNKKGEVVDENGDIIGKLTSGDLQTAVGKKIDDDGDVVDGKGTSVGHVSLLEDIPEPEPEVEEPKESEEEKKKREQREKDDELAGKIAFVIEQSLDKLNPILKQITESIETAERKPKEELDEEALVKKVKPLIESGSAILQETNGAVRGLDPDGRIAANAKHKTASREASPQEYHLAEKLKELATGVNDTINRAKAMIADMPHAKNELNPLWGLLAEPLGQIIAAVGLLLSGVLGLVGKLLGGLGLGGLLDGLLGGLGLKNILNGLGLGQITKSLTGKK